MPESKFTRFIYLKKYSKWTRRVALGMPVRCRVIDDAAGEKVPDGRHYGATETVLRLETHLSSVERTADFVCDARCARTFES